MVHLLVTAVRCAEMAEPIDMPFRIWMCGAKGTMYKVGAHVRPWEQTVLGEYFPAVNIFQLSLRGRNNASTSLL